MDVFFADPKLKKLCADEKTMDRKLGSRKAKLMRRRLAEFQAAVTLSDIRALPGPRCHELKGNRKGQLSVDLDHPHRLIFEPANNPTPTKPDGGLDWSRVTAVRIIEITDTH